MRRKRELTDFGKKVQKRLIDKNMSMTELAAAVGANRTYLNHILCGEKNDRKYKGKIIMVLEMEGA